MDKVYTFIFGRKFLLIIILLTAIVFVISLWHRFIYIDDCWHGEEAYWLAKEGVPKTKSMEGILGFENKIMMYHKLNVILGACIIKIFGWSVYYLKSMTLFFLVLFFVVFYQFSRRFKELYSQQHFILASLFIFVNPLIVYLGFTFRPEILVMCLGFLSYFTLESYLQSLKSKWLVASGIFAGLAFFAHLNGVIFPIAGFILLLYYRKYKPLILFSIVAFCTCMLYSFDLWQGNNFQLFIYQLKNCPTIQFGKTYFDTGILNFVANKVVNFLNEHQRFFWSEKVFAFSALFIFALLVKFKLLFSNYRSLVIYTFALILALNIAGDHIAERYLIYYYPQMALIVAISILSMIQDVKKMAVKSVFVFLMACHLFFVLFTFVKIFEKNEDSVAIHRELAEQLDDPLAKVLAPDKFIYNEIERRPILSYHVWEYNEVLSGTKMDQETALRIAYNLGVKYVLLEYAIFTDGDKPWFKDGIIKENPYYVTMKDFKKFKILKRI